MLEFLKRILDPRPRQVQARKPRRIVLRLEALEERWCPAGTSYFWDPTHSIGGGYFPDDKNGGTTYVNWDTDSLGSGKHPTTLPGSSDSVYFDGRKGTGYNGNQPITWDLSSTVGSVSFQNGYNQQMSLNWMDVLGVANNSFVDASSAPTIKPFDGTGGIELTNGAAFTVNGKLTLQGSSLGNGVRFFFGDGEWGEVLENKGTINYTSGGGTKQVGDVIAIPVLNEGTFNLNGNGNMGGLAATLTVKGSDPFITDDYSWYQDVSGGVTNLYGKVILTADAGYYQSAGLLETTDSGPETLQAGSTTDGTIYIDGGTVKINPGMNKYGELDFTGGNHNSTVNFGNGQVVLKVNTTDNKTSDLLKCDGTVNFNQDGGTSSISIAPQGALNGNGDWFVMKYAKEAGKPNVAPAGVTPAFNPNNLEITG